MHKFIRCTAVNYSGHSYIEYSDELMNILRTKKLLGMEDVVLTDIEVFHTTELPTPHLIMSANTSSLYTDLGPINFLWFSKNHQIVARFRK